MVRGENRRELLTNGFSLIVYGEFAFQLGGLIEPFEGTCPEQFGYLTVNSVEG